MDINMNEKNFEKKDEIGIKSQKDFENWYQNLLDNELCLMHGNKNKTNNYCKRKK